MLEENLKKIFDEISQGNNLGEKITLVGATKTVSPEIINRAVACGLNVVAENKAQEFRDKHQLVNNAVWHFIGHLQSNKVKYLVGKVSLIQSVDSLSLAEAISTEAKKRNVVQDILVEINVGGELSKSGFNPDNAYDCVKKIAKIPNIKVKGLMAMLPKTQDKQKQSQLCLQMRKIFDKLKEDGLDMTYLSVGMSADYKVAIKNGSNMIRLGSLIFGERNYGEK